METLKLSRRGFLGTVGAVPFALTVDWKKVEAKKKEIKPPIETLYEPIPEGWYDAKIVSLFEAEPEKYESRYGIHLRILDGKYNTISFFSSKNLHSMIPMLTACKIYNTQQIDLADCIGKNIRVHIDRKEYRGKIVNHVDEYLALEE